MVDKQDISKGTLKETRKKGQISCSSTIAHRKQND